MEVDTASAGVPVEVEADYAGVPAKIESERGRDVGGLEEERDGKLGQGEGVNQFTKAAKFDNGAVKLRLSRRFRTGW
jgi:hypothetical protein